MQTERQTERQTGRLTHRYRKTDIGLTRISIASLVIDIEKQTDGYRMENGPPGKFAAKIITEGQTD